MRRLSVVLALSVFLLQSARAEDPIFFEDANLQAAVENVLWVSDPTPTDMRTLTILTAGNMEIRSLVGLEYATNLRYLSVRLNDIRDLSPLSGLTSLTNLVLHKNPIQDLSPLSSLTNLTSLDLSYTNTSDVSALAPLTALQTLLLYENSISDISALTSFTSLTYLDLRHNALSDEALLVHIPQIEANNPGIDLKHDVGPSVESYSVTLSSTHGGSVVCPGEGTFTYANVSNPAARLEARANPGYVFVAWTGSYYSTANPVVIYLDHDHEICATFLSLAREFHVDDDAPGDPDPNSHDDGDPDEDGTAEHPFDSIQEAIEAADEGAIILVRPGLYRENIVISRRSIYLTGRAPDDPNGTTLPVIEARQKGSVVSISGNEDTYCELSGFVITGGCGQAAVIDCSNADATISGCLIAGNRPTGNDSALIQCTDSNVALANCTIADNYVETCRGAIRALGSTVALTNSIFYHNTCGCPDVESSSIFADDTAEILISYSNVEGGWPGKGNIDEDPLFACRGQWTAPQNPLVAMDPGNADAVWLMGDYHLLSSIGRWDAVVLDWLCDDADSPCINAGNQTDPVRYEPAPNGAVINMGIYGGTTEASKGYTVPALP